MDQRISPEFSPRPTALLIDSMTVIFTDSRAQWHVVAGDKQTDQRQLSLMSGRLNVPAELIWSREW